MGPKTPAPERNREAEGGFKPAIQNFARYFATGVQSKSDKGLTGSSTGSLQLAPGYYSLGVEGNVPFVILKGPTRQQKSLSWGETIAIPEGFAATLFNDSYHPGDIVLKGGRDWPTVPSRITVPVDFDVVSFDSTHWTITPKWPVDARRARAAWLVWNVTLTGAVNIPVQGRRVEGSHYTRGNVGPGYDETITLGAGPFRYLPLGYGSPPPSNTATFVPLLPMALLDIALPLGFQVLKVDAPTPADVPMYYVLEY